MRWTFAIQYSQGDGRPWQTICLATLPPLRIRGIRPFEQPSSGTLTVDELGVDLEQFRLRALPGCERRKSEFRAMKRGKYNSEVPYQLPYSGSKIPANGEARGTPRWQAFSLLSCPSDHLTAQKAGPIASPFDTLRRHAGQAGDRRVSPWAALARAEVQ